MKRLIYFADDIGEGPLHTFRLDLLGDQNREDFEEFAAQHEISCDVDADRHFNPITREEVIVGPVSYIFATNNVTLARLVMLTWGDPD
jgi:hypothetical protein